MSCKSCSSDNLQNFQTEIAVHLKDKRSPHVFIFPEIVVCFECGLTQFLMEEDTLKVLAPAPALAAVK